MMIQLVMHDFGVEPISDMKGEILFLKVDTLLYKFVWMDGNGQLNRIEQFLIMRHELAVALRSYIKSGKSPGKFELMHGARIAFSGNRKHLQLKFTTGMSKKAFPVTDNQGLFISTLLKDVEVLERNELKMNDTSKGKIRKALLGESNTQEGLQDDLNPEDWEILMFEHSLGRNRRKKLFSLSSIYSIFLKRDFTDVTSITLNLFSNFDQEYVIEHCDCGYEGCFFETLKANQRYFFKGDYHEENGEINNEKVLHDFGVIWSNLSPRQKAVLIFLYQGLGNSTLLNLAFVKPDFNLTRYQYLMCLPYQSDDPDEYMVRSFSTFAYYFIKRQAV